MSWEILFLTVMIFLPIMFRGFLHKDMVWFLEKR